MSPLFFLVCSLACGSKESRTDDDGDGFMADVDCNDANPAIHPDADEVCDEVDNDCSGSVDDDPVDGTTYYADEDDDDYYGDAVTVVACRIPEGYGFAADDCDDTNAAIYPEAEEACDGIDNNCDDVLPANERDEDEDGSLACEDCDDTRNDVFPGAPELCDERDNDCDDVVDEEGTWFRDADGDKYGTPDDSKVAACDSPPSGYVNNYGDCDDTKKGINPDGKEVCDEADTDEDCDGAADDEDDSTAEPGKSTWYLDSDGDGYGGAPGLFCDTPSEGYTTVSGDCDDTTSIASPAIADETCGDGVDNNCDGSPNVCGGLYGDIALADASARLIGEDPYDHAGVSVASAGDMNADGYTDLLIGAYTDDDGGYDAGAAYLVYGPVSGNLDLSLADAKLVGEHQQAFAGASVASAGDVDGDGHGDLLVGAYGDDRGGDMAGAAYLVYGPLVGDLNLSLADAKLIGEQSMDYAGGAIASGGDMDGDGNADLVVAASRHDSNTGAVYLVYGPVLGDLDLSLADAKLTGEAKYNKAGASVACAGDINGDGNDDLLVGASGNASVGAAYLMYGPVLGGLNLSLADAKLIGEQVSDAAGAAVASAGDVNGDGQDDVLVGAYGAGGDSTGAAYLVYGPVSGDLDLSLADAKLIGEDAGDLAGESLASAGDVNGDGNDDLLVGARGDDDGGADAGATYLVYGPVSGDLDLSLADAKFTGEHDEARSGWGVAPSGDVNGDGYDDFLIGAKYYGGQTGAAYLLLGALGL